MERSETIAVHKWQGEKVPNKQRQPGNQRGIFKQLERKPVATCQYKLTPAGSVPTDCLWTRCLISKWNHMMGEKLVFLSPSPPLLVIKIKNKKADVCKMISKPKTVWRWEHHGVGLFFSTGWRQRSRNSKGNVNWEGKYFKHLLPSTGVMKMKQGFHKTIRNDARSRMKVHECPRQPIIWLESYRT